MPRSLLVKNAHMLVTMDEHRREIRDGGMYIEDNRIVQTGPTSELPPSADEVLDMRGHLVIPGLVNTHHHMYQSLTRAIPAAQNAELFGWLTNLYRIWAHLTPEMIDVSTKTAMAELLLSGCTTSSDHLYIYPNGSRLDDSIAAAREIGMRFHAARGSMSVGQKDGGLPPDSVVEKEDAILKDSQRLIETYHDEGRCAMLRVVVAPCSPFSVSRELMRDSALLAREYGVSLHTHLAENVNDVAYSREKFGMTPAEYAEDLGWVGHDVWHAHCVQLDRAGIELFARTGTGVAHCPCSNMRLASGIAPIRAMRDAGVPVERWCADGRGSASGAAFATCRLRAGRNDCARGARNRDTRWRESAQSRRHRCARARHGGGFRVVRPVAGGVCRRAARSGGGARVLRAVAGVDECHRREDRGEGRAADDSRSGRGGGAPQSPGAGAG
jgi:cytosine/adenosine deaminase-related metal-dependent hydrolase